MKSFVISVPPVLFVGCRQGSQHQWTAALARGSEHIFAWKNEKRHEIMSGIGQQKPLDEVDGDSWQRANQAGRGYLVRLVETSLVAHEPWTSGEP